MTLISSHISLFIEKFFVRVGSWFSSILGGAIIIYTFLKTTTVIEPYVGEIDTWLIAIWQQVQQFIFVYPSSGYILGSIFVLFGIFGIIATQQIRCLSKDSTIIIAQDKAKEVVIEKNLIAQMISKALCSSSTGSEGYDIAVTSLSKKLVRIDCFFAHEETAEKGLRYPPSEIPTVIENILKNDLGYQGEIMVVLRKNQSEATV